MDDRWMTLARRAVACRDWSWQPGMLAQTATSEVPDLRYLDGGCWWDIGIEEVMLSDPDDPLPDLTDPATIGCVLALVREAHLQGHISVAFPTTENGHWVVSAGSEVIAHDATEAGALVAALEAAPQ